MTEQTMVSPPSDEVASSSHESWLIARPVKWGKVLNQEDCIGCHACSTACKSEHLVPLGVNRTYVKQVEVGTYPQVSREFQVTRCNQCDDAPCVQICPVTAMFRRPDGIVDFDREVCIGCKACMAACPYDAIFINPGTHSAEKCNFCAHRIDQGLEPACVTVCPVGAIVVGDLNDVNSDVSRLIAHNKVDVRKPEKGTQPKVFYVGASDYTLNPLKSDYTGSHMYAEQSEGYPVQHLPRKAPEEDLATAAFASFPDSLVSMTHQIQETAATAGQGMRGDIGAWLSAGGSSASLSHLSMGVGTTTGTFPGTAVWPQSATHRDSRVHHSVASVRLAYDVPHHSPWHWPVSLYTWTKSLAAGVFVMFALLQFSGVVLTPRWSVSNAVVGGFFLAMTGVLLIYDLEHPLRFYRLFTRPQWKSWLVRGAWIIGGYSLVLLAQFLLGVLGDSEGTLTLSIFGLTLSGFTAMYTAFLFAQAKGRDLWQNQSLPLHLLTQATLAGAATYEVMGQFLTPPAIGMHVVRMTLLIALGVHLALVVSELAVPHSSAGARVAAHQMTRGAYAPWYWTGLVLGGFIPFILAWFSGVPGPVLAAAVCSLAGLLSYEHAYVQAGQSVPLS